MSGTLDGVRVLIVDDSDDTRELFAMVLKDAGAEVLAVADGREAMRAVLQWPPRVVVSDLKLRGADGCEILGELRSLEHLRHVPAIAVSGKTAPGEAKAALDAGFQEHVAKPLEPDALVRTVERWAARS